MSQVTSQSTEMVAPVAPASPADQGAVQPASPNTVAVAAQGSAGTGITNAPAAVAKRQWPTALLKIPCKEPLKCCLYCWVPCIPLKKHRELLLPPDAPYICCMGNAQCCGPLKKPMPKACFFAEMICCSSSAVLAHRYEIEATHNLESTKVENFLIKGPVCGWCMARACILLGAPKGAADSCKKQNLCACCVQGCMHVQHEIELTDNPIAPGPKPQAMA